MKSQNIIEHLSYISSLKEIKQRSLMIES